MHNLTVGFDLDMTLVDSRAGIAATMDALAAETGVWIDSAVAVNRLGPPLEVELRNWFPADQVPGAADRYRELAPDLAPSRTTEMPGAHQAIASVRRCGGRVVVVTAKHAPTARAILERLGFDVDEVVGHRWGPDKGEALRERGAHVYVGDHLGDVEAARVAGALGVSVPTGPCDADELRAAGADVVLPDLTAFPAWLEEYVLRERLAALEVRLAGLDGVLVAFSGGADSAFLLAAAARALGPAGVVAATAVSPSLPAAELEAAAAFARELGVRHLTPRTDEMRREAYQANDGDRCYFCKAELLEVLTPLARELGLPDVATGTNADDARAGFRPGIRAAAERGAVTPLLDVGLTKRQIREASRRWGLRTWDKPATACLSSRVAYGVRITPHRLARVERAEAALRAALRSAEIPATNLRVRDLGDRARIEVDLPVVERVAQHDAALAAVRAAGFAGVEVDPRGFRSGAMNELLAEPERYR